ncbi:MAG: alpha/beta-hydrolase family protein [Actinobacteria bacterium]|nr:alpha/beta-hydrolase family protein [Actinomycetota bacterium]
MGAVVFWAMSLVPTLMPRTAVTQAAMSGLCLAIGYGLGTLVGAPVRAILARTGRTPSDRVRGFVRRGVVVAAAVVAVVGAAFWVASQRHQRAALTMGPLPVSAVIVLVPLSLLLAGVFVVIGRALRGVTRLVARGFAVIIPQRTASPLAVGLVVVLVVFVAWPALRGTFDSWANSSFSITDASTTPGTHRPDAPTVSGSPASLVRWDDLGRQGRDFVADATPKAELAKVDGVAADEVTSPIRVYVGRQSAASNDARATLAVRELERTGAFKRKVLAVVTATGSGWVDPDAAKALEALYGGDTAIVSQQYSFLPSWIATLLEPDASGEAGSALFEAVHAHWAALPAASRPKLLVFGLSLGSFGTEAEFAGPTAQASLANLTSRTDGVLLVGPTASNPIWRQLTDGRDSGSPVWRPVYGGGTVVRFDGRSLTLQGIDDDWRAPRVLYVQHPTDPVTFWDESWFWRKPEIMRSPHGEAVVARTWFPIVSGVQGVFDLMAGFGAPPGFGHDYRLDYVRAWAQVAPPSGWTDAKTVALEARLHS